LVTDLLSSHKTLLLGDQFLSLTQREAFVRASLGLQKKIQVLVAFLPPDETTDCYQVSGVSKTVVGFLA